MKNGQQSFVDRLVQREEIDSFAIDGFFGYFVWFLGRVWQVIELLSIEEIFHPEALSHGLIFESFSFGISELVSGSVIEGNIVQLTILFHGMLHNLKVT